MNKDIIDLHADDFAVSVHASKDILECVRQGKLTSISIMPNMSCFKECINLLTKQWDRLNVKPMISIHLNVMEGHCCSNKEDVPDLVDEQGYFNVSWGSLLKASYTGAGTRIKDQLKKEIKKQIEVLQAALPFDWVIRIDSHQHTHMIPVVWLAFTQVWDEEHLTIQFVRVAQEPLGPFIKQIRLYRTYNPVNIVKNIILNYYSIRVNRDLRHRNVKSTLLWGLIMSGNMDIKRINSLYDSMTKVSRRKGKTLEILFHPGTVLKEEMGEEFVKEGFRRFHLSGQRAIERKAVEQL